jgi:hypothetical protein
MKLDEISSDVDEYLFTTDFCRVAGHPHSWVLEELSSGHVVLPTVPGTGDNLVLERTLA